MNQIKKYWSKATRLSEQKKCLTVVDSAKGEKGHCQCTCHAGKAVDGIKEGRKILFLGSVKSDADPWTFEIDIIDNNHFQTSHQSRPFGTTLSSYALWPVIQKEEEPLFGFHCRGFARPRLRKGAELTAGLWGQQYEQTWAASYFNPLLTLSSLTAYTWRPSGHAMHRHILMYWYFISFVYNVEDNGPFSPHVIAFLLNVSQPSHRTSVLAVPGFMEWNRASINVVNYMLAAQ